jgi:glycosyltransferase involved in cell wall biosynthesis
VLDQKQALPKLISFKERWKDVPKANGVCPPEIKARRPKDWHKEFKWNAVRFANKVYAVFDAAQRCESDWIVWMDADMYIHSPMSKQAIEKVLPNKSWLSYLGRGKKWPECGFYGINLRTVEGQEFLKEFEHVYEHAEYGIFRMEEWHDSYVFEEVRKKIYAKFPNSPIFNISGDIINGEGHPLINSDLGKYMDHLKGDRKQAGKSNKPKDLVVKRPESYWQ